MKLTACAVIASLALFSFGCDEKDASKAPSGTSGMGGSGPSPAGNPTTAPRINNAGGFDSTAGPVAPTTGPAVK